MPTKRPSATAVPNENGMPVFFQNHQNVLRARLRSDQLQMTVSDVHA